MCSRSLRRGSTLGKLRELASTLDNLHTYTAVPGSRACLSIALDRYLIIKPSASDRIHGPIDNGVGSEASFHRSDRVKTLTDREKPVFKLGLLRRGQAKPYADRRKAARIVTKPRFHRLFIRRNA